MSMCRSPPLPAPLSAPGIPDCCRGWRVLSARGGGVWMSPAGPHSPSGGAGASICPWGFGGPSTCQGPPVTQGVPALGGWGVALASGAHLSLGVEVPKNPPGDHYRDTPGGWGGECVCGVSACSLGSLPEGHLWAWGGRRGVEEGVGGWTSPTALGPCWRGAPTALAGDTRVLGGCPCLGRGGLCVAWGIPHWPWEMGVMGWGLSPGVPDGPGVPPPPPPGVRMGDRGYGGIGGP